METDTVSYISEKTKSFLDLFQSQPHKGPLKSTQQAHQEAVSYLAEHDAPTTRTERWKYTRIGRIINGNWIAGKPDAPFQMEDFNIPDFDGYSAVFINGHFHQSSSKLPTLAGVTVLPMHEAVRQCASIVDAHFGSLSNHQGEWFEALNTAFATGGLFVYLTKNTVLDKPLRIVQVNSGNKVWSQPRHLIVQEASSHLEIVQHTVCTADTEAFSNGLIEAFVAENATFKLNQIQDEQSHTFAVNTTRIKQLRHSKVTVNTMTVDGDWVRNDLYILVDGENCETHMNGVYMPKGKQLVDNHTTMDHLKPHCTSYELYKGIMTDNATGVFNGKVFVRQDAQQTNAFQQNGNILLSDDAAIYSKPELEIYADDVKCSHGSTTGQFDDEALFYLRARGIGESTARKLLVAAFVSDAIEPLEHESLISYVTHRLGIQH